MIGQGSESGRRRVDFPGFVALKRTEEEQTFSDADEKREQEEQEQEQELGQRQDQGLGGRLRAGWGRKSYCWQTYHGVNMSDHLVWGDPTVFLQELPRGSDIILDPFRVPGHVVARVILDFRLIVL